MKNSRLKLLLLVLVMFSFTFFMSLGTTKAIYRETKSTSINLSVVEAPLSYTVDFVTNNGDSVPSRKEHFLFLQKQVILLPVGMMKMIKEFVIQL